MKKLKQSALTFFHIQEGIDDGDIILQEKFNISENDDATSLYEKIINIGKKMIVQLLCDFQQKTVKHKKQISSEFIENWSKRTPEDGKINWSDSAQDIHTLIRASTHPYPGAFTIFKNQKLRIWKALYSKESNPRGTICTVSSNEVKIGTKKGTIIIQEASLNNEHTLQSIFNKSDIGKKLEW